MSLLDSMHFYYNKSMHAYSHTTIRMLLCSTYMCPAVHNRSMADTSIRVSNELADELYERKGRSTSYEDYIWELLDEVDSHHSSADREPAVEPEPPTADDFGGVLDDAREAFADDPDARQQARVDSLRAALVAVRESPLSKSEIQAAAYPEDAEIGQNERTWFRKTVKPFLKEVATYSSSDHKWHWSG